MSDPDYCDVSEGYAVEKAAASLSRGRLYRAQAAGSPRQWIRGVRQAERHDHTDMAECVRLAKQGIHVGRH